MAAFVLTLRRSRLLEIALMLVRLDQVAGSAAGVGVKY
jgi:hypothetical protein